MSWESFKQCHIYRLNVWMRVWIWCCCCCFNLGEIFTHRANNGMIWGMWMCVWNGARNLMDFYGSVLTKVLKYIFSSCGLVMRWLICCANRTRATNVSVNVRWFPGSATPNMANFNTKLFKWRIRIRAKRVCNHIEWVLKCGMVRRKWKTHIILTRPIPSMTSFAWQPARKCWWNQHSFHHHYHRQQALIL